jgi:hypothetical protein
MEDLKDTYYLDHRGSRNGSLTSRPLPVFMNISESPIVEAVPTPDIPANNETVTFDFYVQDVADMYGWQIIFEFNPQELEFIEFTTSQKGYFLHDFASKHNHPTIKAGMVFNKTGLTYMQAGECISSWFGAQASGSGKLCSFTFKKLVATSEPTITLMEDLEDTYYCAWEGRNFQTRVDKPLPMFMNMSEP